MNDMSTQWYETREGQDYYPPPPVSNLFDQIVEVVYTNVYDTKECTFTEDGCEQAKKLISDYIKVPRKKVNVWSMNDSEHTNAYVHIHGRIPEFSIWDVTLRLRLREDQCPHSLKEFTKLYQGNGNYKVTSTSKLIDIHNRFSENRQATTVNVCSRCGKRVRVVG